MKLKKYIILLIMLTVYNCCILKLLQVEAYLSKIYRIMPVNSNEVKNLCIDVNFQEIKVAADNMGVDFTEYTTILWIVNDYCVTKETPNINEKQYKRLLNRMIYYTPKEFNALKKLINSILCDIKYFPIPKSTNREEWVYFSDSWGYNRDYGSTKDNPRHHEGTDVMADINKDGLYPVLSLSDGVVESVGWLELGGYRVGIRSNNGMYYYYAHLDSYGDGIIKGAQVKAGQFLGFMGNTGYSKVEGTKGKFAVHLHFGIYMDVEGVETAYNPYYLLKNLRENVLYYNY